MPKSQPSPKHAKLPNLVGNNLIGLSHSIRWQLADSIARLYKLRLMADYVPQTAVEERDARIALGLMEHAFRCMKGYPVNRSPVYQASIGRSSSGVKVFILIPEYGLNAIRAASGFETRRRITGS